MWLHPAILALLGVSLASVSLVVANSRFALIVLRRWDLASGSEQQLILERRTYLVSTAIGLVLIGQILALWLFIYTTESLAPQFIGAMCATGVLNTSPWGFLTLELKLINFFVAGLWLAIDRLDTMGYDYPLIRYKYGLLLILAPLLLAEAISQLLFFAELKPDVITSCCGALFNPNTRGVAGELAGVSPLLALVWLGIVTIVTLGSGILLLRQLGQKTAHTTIWWGWGYVILIGINFLVAIGAIVSAISLYVYQAPHHHCPFCLLKANYYYVGYGLYLSLFIGTGAGLATMVALFSSRYASLNNFALLLAKRWLILSLWSLFLFASLTSGLVIYSDLAVTALF